MDNTTISLTELINQTKKRLDMLGYADGTIKHYELIWNHFTGYARLKNQNHFTKQLGNNFLNDRYGIIKGMKLSNSQVFKVRSIIILNEMLKNNKFQMCHQKKKKSSSTILRNIKEIRETAIKK